MPVNYQVDVVNPFQSALQGYGAGAQMLQQDRAFEQQKVQQAQQSQLFQAQMQEQQMRAAKLKAEMADAEAMKGVYSEYSDIMSKVRENNDPSLLITSGIIDRLAPINEKMAEYAQGQFADMDTKQKAAAHKNVMEPAVAAAQGNWDVMTSLLERQADALAESGQEEQANLVRGMAEQSKNPKTREVVADTLLARAIQLDPKATSEQLETLGKATKLPLDEQLIRAQINREQAAARFDAARAKMEATGGGKVQSSNIMDDGTTIMLMADGSRRVLDPTGKLVEGEMAQQAIARANQVGADLQAQRAGGRRGAAIGQDVAKDAMVSLGKVRANMLNLDRVVEAIDKGASSGLIESQLPATNAATVELRNLQNQLGLDVIGAVTFGALSEGELNLALNVALPTNLQPADLRSWVLRKKAAQQKLAGYMEEQAKYLSIPGTNVGGWLAHLESMGGGAPPPGRPTPTPTPSSSSRTTLNWGELR